MQIHIWKRKELLKIPLEKTKGKKPGWEKSVHLKHQTLTPANKAISNRNQTLDPSCSSFLTHPWPFFRGTFWLRLRSGPLLTKNSNHSPLLTKLHYDLNWSMFLWMSLELFFCWHLLVRSCAFLDIIKFRPIRDLFHSKHT